MPAMIQLLDVTPFVTGQTVAQKPVRGSKSATIHISVNGMSFWADNVRFPRSALRSASRVAGNHSGGLSMIDQESAVSPVVREWTGWPRGNRTTEILQRALTVIATTQHEWTSRASAPAPPRDQSVLRRGRCAVIFL